MNQSAHSSFNRPSLGGSPKPSQPLVKPLILLICIGVGYILPNEWLFPTIEKQADVVVEEDNAAAHKAEAIPAEVDSIRPVVPAPIARVDKPKEVMKPEVVVKLPDPKQDPKPPVEPEIIPQPEIVEEEVLIQPEYSSKELREQAMRLKKLMPKRGYETLGLQPKHELGGMTTPKEEIAAYPYNLGPTGILAQRDKQTMSYKVTEVEDDSPAIGLVEVGDVIYGANGKKFTEIKAAKESEARYPNPQMGLAIEEAESSKAAMLELLVKRNGKKMSLSLQLKPLGAFGKGFPKQSAKGDYLAALHAKILAEQQGENGMWDTGFSGASKHRGKFLPTCMAGLALMSTGDPRYKPQIRKAFKAIIENKPRSFRTWQYSYKAVFLAEYYLRYGDSRCKKEIKLMVDELAEGAFYYNGVYGYGHGLIAGNYRYGGINVCTAHAALTFAVAKVVGVEVPKGMDDAMARSIERLAPDGAMDYAWSARRRGPITQVKHNEDQGRTGVALMAYRLLGGRAEQQQKMVDYMLLNKEYADCGHSSGGSISWVWGGLGLGFDSEKEYEEMMQSRIWYFNFNRRHDAGFYLQPSVHLQFRPSDTVLGAHYVNAGNVLLLNWSKHNLLITGKKEWVPKRKEVYKEELIAASDYFERQDRVVEIAEAASLMMRKTPRSVKDLMEALKRVRIESPKYDKEVADVYRKHLERAVRDVANTSLPENIRRDAMAALLGINYNCQMSIRGDSARITHRVTCANYGDFKLKAEVEGVKKDIDVRVEVGENRGVQKWTQSARIKGGDLSATLSGKTVIRWKSYQLEFQHRLEHSEGVRGKWSRNPSDTVYGPFYGVVEKAKDNGSLQVRIAGDVLVECSFMGVAEIIDGKKKLTYADWKKKNKEDIEPGTKVRFTYFNRGGNTLLPMCDSVEIL